MFLRYISLSWITAIAFFQHLELLTKNAVSLWPKMKMAVNGTEKISK